MTTLSAAPPVRSTWLHRLAMLLWAVGLVSSAFRIQSALRRQVLAGVPWETAKGDLLEFRDVVLVPGSYLMHGGNPYDPIPYLAQHPWAQEFDPYAPSWFLIAGPLSLLRPGVAALIFLVGMVAVGIVFSRMLAAWAVPTHALIVAPALFAWLNLWYPGQYALTSGSSFIVVTGVLMALRSLDRGHWDHPWLGAVGVALAMTKPQFGVPLVILLAAARAGLLAARGLALCALASLPATVAAMIAAGGPVGLAASFWRDVQQASSPDSPTGLASPLQLRGDLVGLAVRNGLAPPPTLIQILVDVLVLGVAAWALRRRLDPRLSALVIVPAITLVPVHVMYDLVATTIPTLVALGWWLTDRSRKDVLLVGALAGFTLFHVHGVLLRLTSATPALLEGVDALTMLASLLTAVAIVVRNRRREEPRAP